jgi:hypothetical protein
MVHYIKYYRITAAFGDPELDKHLVGTGHTSPFTFIFIETSSTAPCYINPNESHFSRQNSWEMIIVDLAFGAWHSIRWVILNDQLHHIA